MAKCYTPMRILMDSNVWRYLIDAERQGDIIQLAKSGRIEIQIAPAIVYEALRCKDHNIKRKLISFMTNINFKRLMPDAYSESIEIINEIGRLLPEWMRKDPLINQYRRLLKDWSRKKGGFWVRCARNFESESHFIHILEGDLLSDAERILRNHRRQMRDNKLNELIDINQPIAHLPYPARGWNGEKFEPWRIQTLVGITHSLREPISAYRDWMAPWINFEGGLLSSPDWVEFWLHRTEATRVPRQWLRAAHDMAQRFRSVNHGSIVDNQIYTYLMETDIVVTSDRIFIGILEDVRKYAPFKLPVGEIIRGGKDGVDDFFHLARKI